MNKVSFDIGGNGVQCLYNEVVSSFSTVGKDKEFVLNEISKFINENKITDVGISSPCGVDSVSGQLFGISGIKGYENFNIYEELREKLVEKEVKIFAANDANAALMGNLIGVDVKSAAQITIGTGIGGAIMSESKIQTNKLAMAGEFGYIPFRNGKNTSEVCSANALVKRINEDFNNDYKDFKSIEPSKYESYLPTIQSWSNDVAKLLMQIAFSISPEKIFISGGIAKNKYIEEKILSSFEKMMSSFKYDFYFDIEFKNIDNAALRGIMEQL